jgi:hypothetical protein
VITFQTFILYEFWPAELIQQTLSNQKGSVGTSLSKFYKLHSG